MDAYTESSGVDTSPEMNSSFELPRVQLSSPEPKVKPRKLMFHGSPGDSGDEEMTSGEKSPVPDPSLLTIPSQSPPYRSIRQLRLFDSPATPKTIVQKSQDHRSSSKMLKFLSTNNNNTTAHEMSTIGTPEHCDRSHAEVKEVRANLNPFTPQGLMMRNKKRCRIEDDLNVSAPAYTFGASQNFVQSFAGRLRHNLSDGITESECRQAPKRIALQETDISRYEKEFVELDLIGTGDFGLVYRCLNRLDGCVYAIKKSIKPVAGSAFEKAALNEVWAHAVLGEHDNVVRYYSAWAEDQHMIIQNEYCNGGSLQTVLQECHLVESELRTVLLHIAEGLKYIHSNDLVHMDIKAGNIFLSKVLRKTQVDGDDGFEDSCDEFDNDYITTYKIGDLGHVTSVQDPHVEEGDCRYLAQEVLHDDYTNLQKSDIFSLGITLYEAAGGGPLPKNGPEWHKLRGGQFPDLPNLSKEFNQLLKLMMHPKPEERPSSTSIFNHPFLYQMDTKSKAQLSRELSMERQRNHILKKRLAETKRLLKSYEFAHTPPQMKSKMKRECVSVSDRKLRSHTKRKQQKRRRLVDSRRPLEP